MILPERFWSKVEIDPESGCWTWTGGTSTNGYGKAYGTQGLSVYVHRMAYEALVSPAPGFVIDHYRMNPGPRNAPCSKVCVNPAHLEPVTRGENTLRGNSCSAKNARKTHCKHGHEFTPANTYTWRTGRCCLVCRKERDRRRV